MAAEKLVAKLINMIAQSQAKKETLSRYAAPRRDDVLHDGMVGSGETWGGILGATLGGIGGEIVGGLPGAVAGSVALGTGGSLAGGWAAHGAYREGQLIREILTNPQDWTVDAAGAIVPVMPPADPNAAPPQGAAPRSGMVNNSSSLPCWARSELATPSTSRAAAGRPGGFPGLIAGTGNTDAMDSARMQPPAGGLLGMIQDYMRTQSVDDGAGASAWPPR
ncbi:hypothetical protein HL666_16135 [Bradyrhizobium sp. 83002]|uniref:hypothetical protein n=1 Tax=Bradyrhizobium aeschynomenes TaxID=2734909 RepID=UPI001557388F|nr:hypothetical protein [Bradyrhizobium aeschynomenes]NPU12303.1 hypothetical protein [Bradyrhizobium aeschynomenes]